MVKQIARIIDVSKSLIKGMRLTIHHINVPEATIRYPFEQRQVSERFRGTPKLRDKNIEKFIPTSPPCSQICPAHLNIRGYIGEIAEGRYEKALAIIRDRCPLPASIGRICTRPCETACKRNMFDEALSIRDLKRFAADSCMDLPHPKQTIITKDKKVAIIGAGPAGLTAAQRLAKEGYKVTILDKNPQGGGTLFTGIPKYRLPKHILKWDVDSILALGVELKTGVEIGKDIMLDELISSYDTVVIATGLPAAWTLGIEGEDADGVWNCLDLLREVNLDKTPNIGKKVAVVGGGNVAMDGARTAIRLGAEEVFLVYRRSMEEMPARPEEIHEALEEGINFTILSNPTKVIVKDGKVAGLECIQMGLGEPDASGRRKPEPIPGSEFILEVESVIVAIGQKTDLSFLEGIDIRRNERGGIDYDPLTLQTSISNVFVAGEVVTGAGAAIEAIASGHNAADSIIRYLNNEDLREGRSIEVKTKPNKYNKVQLEWISWDRRRANMPTIPLEERALGFKEVELGYSRSDAEKEARRCLVCNTGVCSGCTMCARACPSYCIKVERAYQKNGDGYHKTIAHQIDLTRCMFCGYCAETCPTEALIMSKEFENSESDKFNLHYLNAIKK